MSSSSTTRSAPSPPAEPPRYVPPQDVVFAWIAYHALRYSGQKASIKWLMRKTGLAKNTVLRWRREYFALLATEEGLLGQKSEDGGQKSQHPKQKSQYCEKEIESGD